MELAPVLVDEVVAYVDVVLGDRPIVWYLIVGSVRFGCDEVPVARTGDIDYGLAA
ncbi:hypothetical protein [Gemmatimonas sp.]|uniref:hypothetical protein n=1 Tax=Gemmatimonas sp. TaxID=1962908 RepID=UPI003567DF5D